jgi:hypothetical protein
VTAAPPLSVGAAHEMVAEASAGVAETAVGAPGIVTGASGVTAVEGVDAGPEPENRLAAETVKLYGVPLVRPETTADVAVVPVTRGDGAPAPLVVTVYDERGSNGLAGGAVQLTVAERLPATAVTPVGAAGVAARAAGAQTSAPATTNKDRAPVHTRRVRRT